jgi:peroxiredoxin
MNERIKELADKAFVTVSSDGYFSSGKFCEKFAELIVRECARVASNQVMDVEGNDWGVKHAVEKHFGVEE